MSFAPGHGKSDTAWEHRGEGKMQEQEIAQNITSQFPKMRHRGGGVSVLPVVQRPR